MPAALVQLVSEFGYPIVFLSVLLMNAGVPVPGHYAYLVAAIMAGRGVLQLPALMAVATVASVAGAVTGFFLGQRGGRRIVLVYGPRLGLTPARLSLMERFFARFGVWAVFFTRFIVVVRTFGALFAGISRAPARLFIIVSSAGAVAWALFFGAAGYIFGDRWTAIEGLFGRAGLAILGALALAGLAHALWRRSRRRRRRSDV